MTSPSPRKSPPTEAQRLRLVQQRWPAAAQLARLLSLAVRIEPSLLRAARLAAGLDATSEADLWFSGIIVSSGTLGVSFVPAVAEALRRELAASPGERALAWKLVRGTSRSAALVDPAGGADQLSDDWTVGRGVRDRGPAGRGALRATQGPGARRTGRAGHRPLAPGRAGKGTGCRPGDPDRRGGRARGRRAPRRPARRSRPTGPGGEQRAAALAT